MSTALPAAHEVCFRPVEEPGPLGGSGPARRPGAGWAERVGHWAGSLPRTPRHCIVSSRAPTASPARCLTSRLRSFAATSPRKAFTRMRRAPPRSRGLLSSASAKSARASREPRRAAALADGSAAHRTPSREGLPAVEGLVFCTGSSEATGYQHPNPNAQLLSWIPGSETGERSTKVIILYPIRVSGGTAFSGTCWRQSCAHLCAGRARSSVW